ncbi:hypothetical protein CI109_104157 [Kwoniella shandongensis]|uniref:Uncharacterized protein n=1 Tax=Kwoniella shandongensis TaxID=1734106 RepID=A0A5M6C4Q8_9TREE|nr:uncharacterized protein CI109_002930 [Kwoniella shandongensis]KAA5528772.1 hypothetical protein CI109_002930 [Kwoniella shandongensis]
MPTSLLNLADDTLRLIGDYLDDTDSIPLPSFYPHSENYRHRFDKQLGGSHRRLRNSCRRLHHVLPQGELHVEIKWMFMLKIWMENVPDYFLRSVTRLRINLYKQYAKDLQGCWSDFTTFLTRLPNLEELYLSGTPFCEHRDSVEISTDKLAIPADMILPKLKSFANEIECGHCLVYLEPLLITAPNLQHVKSVFGFNDIGEEEALDTSNRLFDLRRRHNIKATKLETLYLAVNQSYTTEDVLVEFVDSCPRLKEFVITRRIGDKDTRLTSLFDVAALSNRAPRPWQFEVRSESFGRLSELADEFRDLKHLEILDCAMKLELSQYVCSRQSYRGPLRDRDPTAPPAVRNDDRFRVSPERYEDIYAEAIIAATKVFVDKCPSIRTLRFWDDFTQPNTGIINVPNRDWLRWESHVIVDAESGKVEITVERPPKCFTWQFSSNTDGTKMGRQS